MKLKIAFRCDASIQMGSGHVMRCLTLANELREQGAVITFICREHEGNLFNLIKSSGFDLVPLKLGTQVTKGNLAHAHWLGATQEEDVQQMIESLKLIRDIRCVIVDHYALDINWEAEVKKCVNRIMVIDDLADRRHNCDLLLDQNYYSQIELRYENLVPINCLKLLGPKYALLRPEFVEARKSLKIHDGSVKNLFIFFGGSDPTNETKKTLLALQSSDIDDMKINVVVGQSNPNKEQIRAICESNHWNYHCQIKNMAELMSNADLAIGSGGAVNLERCYLGLPSIIIMIAKNQMETSNALAHARVVENLGWYEEVTSSQIHFAIKKLIDTPRKIIEMRDNGLRLMGSFPTQKYISVVALKLSEMMQMGA